MWTLFDYIKRVTMFWNSFWTRLGRYSVLALWLASAYAEAIDLPPSTPVATPDEPTPLVMAPPKISGLITSNWDNFFNITRLQFRSTPEGKRSYTQATFLRFPSKVYIAQVYEETEAHNQDPHLRYFELNLGGPLAGEDTFEKLFGWVCRGQTGTQTPNILSCGLQYNLSEHEGLRSTVKTHKITSFLQIFPLKSHDNLGSIDLVHYYSFAIYKGLYIRGYNNWYHYQDQKDYFRLTQDFIYPINPKFDAYLRQTYQNRSDVQFGQKGSEIALGFRYNFSF